MKIFEKRLVSFLLALALIVGLLPPVSLKAKAETTGLDGKTISILGDSISTYQNYSNGTAAETTNSTIKNGAIYYPTSGFDVTMDSTWWYQAAQALDMEILVNNSWSGSCLLNTRSGAVGAYVDRCVQLHDDTGDNAGQEPDIIAIFLGTNDYYTYPSTLGSYESIAFDTLITKTEAGYAYAEPATSMEAYAIILHKIAQRYPEAEVYCFTLLPRVNSTSQPTAVNEDIRQLANHFGAITVDLHNCGIQPDSTHMGDNLHPNSAGMDAMTNAFVSAVLKNSGEMTYDVSFNLDGVVAMEGTTRTVISGDEFRATLKGKTGNRQLDVSVKMGGADITEACYVDGVVQIPVVNGDVVITASLADRDPLNFRWEYDTQKDALVSGSANGNTENALTMTSGSITDGQFSKVKYTLDEAVILKHDKPWVIEWKSSGTWTDTTDGALLFAGAETSTTADTPYLYRRHNSDFIAFGVSTGGQYHNYGVKLGANGIDGTIDHTYKLENRINADGSNMVYLYVDDQEIGPMNHHWVGGTDKKETVDWLNGKDLVFTHMGTSPHTIGNCYIDYIQVWENGKPDERSLQNFRWEIENNAMVSVATNGNTVNDLTLTSGSITGGALKNIRYSLNEAVNLYHDVPWVIEWRSSGNWDGMLLASNLDTAVNGTTYLFRFASMNFLALGDHTNTWNNYGLIHEIDMSVPHLFRLENRIGADGTNTVYLLVDGVEIDAMHHYYNSGTNQNQIVNWANGRDIVFGNIGTSSHPVNNMQLEYLQIWENGHNHDYRSAVTAPTCTEGGYTTYTCDCGSSYVGDYVDAKGHSYENGSCKVCGAMASNPFAGKTIACIGDSITAAYGVTKDKTDYVKLLADRLEMNYIRLGASGTSLSANGGRVCNIDKLTESKLQGADVVTIAMGINDFCGAGAGYYELGDINSTDSSTIYGAVRMWCEQIVELRKTDSLKDTQFYFMTPLITSWNNSVTSARNWDQSKVNIHGYTLRDLCNAIIEVAALYDVAVIDMNLISGLYYVSAEDNNVDVFGGDGVHPGDEGHAMMAAALEDALLERYLLDDHDHSYGSWITTTYPDCEGGEEKRVCGICRATESRALPAIPTEENVHLSQKAKLQPDGSFTFTLEIYASEKVALYGDAVIRYVLNQGFVMTEMSQIRAVRISEALKDAVLNENKAEAEDLIVRVNESIVDVTGFDLSKEYISDEHSGSKLVITISHVEATDDVIWGEHMDISTADSGIWADEAMAVAFAKSSAFFHESVYVMDYAEEITLDGENIIHLDADGMGGFTNANVRLEMTYGTVQIENGCVVYIPDTMQWNGYDRFYAFAGQNEDYQWAKMAVIPANNVYYEDSCIAISAEEAAQGAGIYYTNGTKPEDVPQDVWDSWNGQWESVSDNKTGNSVENSSDVQGWIENLAGQTGFTGGSAHLVQAMLGQNANGIPKATFTFTGTGVDIYSFTNNTTGTVMVQVSDVKGIYPSSYYIVDTGANTAEGYYQVPTISFVGKGHSTYQVTIMVTTAAASENRFAFYLDGIRVYNPLEEDAKDETVEDAYGDEMHAVFGSVRQMLLDAGSFTGETGEGTGFVFLDRLPESENAGNTNVIGTYAVYGPKNEVYLAKGQAIAFKVDETLYSRVQVGLKSLTGEEVQAVVSYFDEESAAAAQGMVWIAHTADLYYELMPMEGYVVIRNTSDAILAVTKVKLMVSGDPQQISAQVEKVSQAEVLEAVEEFDALPMMTYRLRNFRPDVESAQPEVSVEDVAAAQMRALLEKLFGSVRKWLTK